MIPLFKVHVPPNIGQKIQQVFDEGVITEGIYADTFEKEFGELVGNKNVSLLNSGTSALTLAYKLANLDRDTEIITTPMTCMATNEPAHLAGARLVFADIDPTTGNIDPESVKKRLTKKTRAVVGVHWAGQPFDIKTITDIVKDYDPTISVIEDAAHALGASYMGKPIGTHSDFVCFSFQAIKHLTTVDGGAICSLRPEDDARIKRLRWFGLDRKYPGSRWEQDITEAGYKFHMNNVNAIIGLEQMKYVNGIISAHKKHGLFFDKHIKNDKLTKLQRDHNSESAYWIYTILADDRDDFKSYLYEHGIASDVVHVRNDRYSVFDQYRQDDLVGTEAFCSKMINIPVGYWLTDDNLEKIVSVVNAY